MTGKRRGLVGDERARVPFALLAVVLLVSTVAFVGVLERRDTGTVDTDAGLAVERAEAAVQTELRDGAASAARLAAAEPLTETADNGYGRVLRGRDPFESYLEALVYLEAGERFEATEQRVGAVETTVSLPEIPNASGFASALDRVTVTPEREDGRATGMITVELQGIEIEASREGETLLERTVETEVTIPTPVFQQHERTELFQEQLDAGITEPGFSQRFNARIYALGWMRGYAQWGGAPVTEVIANRHVEPSVNAALYRTQRDVFGAADPNLGNAVDRGWFCMAARDGQALYNGYTAGETNLAGDICRASEWVLGERHTGELPDPPGALDLLEGAPGMDETETIGVNETAQLPLGTLATGGDESIERALERIFAVDVDIRTDIEYREPSFEHDPPAGAVMIDSERTNRGIQIRQGDHRRWPEERIYHRYRGYEVELSVAERATWDTGNGTVTTNESGTLSTTVDIEFAEGTTAPEARTDGPVEHEYAGAPGDETGSALATYTDTPRTVAAAILNGTGGDAVLDWLTRRWSGVTNASGLELPDSERVELGIGGSTEARLTGAVIDDIVALGSRMANVTHTFERVELVQTGGDGPVAGLVDRVERVRGEILGTERYESVGDRVVHEVRHAYFEILLEELERVESVHDETMSGLDEQLEDVGDGLSGALTHLQEAVSPGGDPDTAVEADAFEAPELMPNITYEVSGSPTYLAGEVVTAEQVPAVEGEFAPLAMKNANHLKLPYESIVDGVLGRLANLLGVGDPDAELTFRAAGEALQAGELARAAAAEDGYADERRLRELSDTLEGELAAALEEFTAAVGRRVTDRLYSDGERAMGASGAVTDELERAIEAYDGPAETAIAIGEGRADERLTSAAADALAPKRFRPENATNLSTEDWREVVESVTQSVVVESAAAEAVTLEDTGDVEALDTQVRRALENVSADIVDERLAQQLGNGRFDLSEYDGWVDGVETPVRVPAGLPILPLPTNWVATVNVWDIVANGQYARFEVSANVSAPGRASSVTYVRENVTVEREIAGERRRLGSVEPVGFDGRSMLIVVVPPGGIGVGDRDDEDPECSETYPVTGAFDPERVACG
jgi:hypothetical protein